MECDLQSLESSLELMAGKKPEELKLKNGRFLNRILSCEKKAKALQNNPAPLTAILDNIPSPVCCQDSNGVYVSANQAFARQIFGFEGESMTGGIPAEAIHRSSQVHLKRFSPQNEYMAQYFRISSALDSWLLKYGGAHSYEYEGICADGKRRVFLVNKSTLRDEKGVISGLITVMSDITPQRRAEKARMETEKALENIGKIRKKEIHHRIKNNLQVISSLLDLQAEKSGNKELTEMLKESQKRIVAISLIHEELYGSGNPEALDFAAYLRKLTSILLGSEQGSKILMNIDVEEAISFNMDTAVPLGIIVNELVSNSLKHAFSGKKEGKIHIQLYRNRKNQEIFSESSFKSRSKSRSKRNCLLLNVSDNGSGIPENIDPENPDSLGLQLVKLLTDQLEGEIILKRERGTEFEIRFAELESQT